MLAIAEQSAGTLCVDLARLAFRRGPWSHAHEPQGSVGAVGSIADRCAGQSCATRGQWRSGRLRRARIASADADLIVLPGQSHQIPFDAGSLLVAQPTIRFARAPLRAGTARASQSRRALWRGSARATERACSSVQDAVVRPDPLDRITTVARRARQPGSDCRLRMRQVAISRAVAIRRTRGHPASTAGSGRGTGAIRVTAARLGAELFRSADEIRLADRPETTADLRSLDQGHRRSARRRRRVDAHAATRLKRGRIRRHFGQRRHQSTCGDRQQHGACEARCEASLRSGHWQPSESPRTRRNLQSEARYPTLRKSRS
jgi:hypothetical protein